jgi:hypothetical protein
MTCSVDVSQPFSDPPITEPGVHKNVPMVAEVKVGCSVNRYAMIVFIDFKL